MKRFNFFKYTTLGNKVHTSYFDYWFFKKLTQGEPVTPAIEGEGTDFELVTTSKKKLDQIKLKGDTTQQTYTGKNLFNLPATESKNDVTFTRNLDGTFDLFGVPSANTNFSIVVEGKLEGGEYTLSRNTGNFAVSVQDWNSSGWLSQLLTLNNASSNTGSINPVGTRTGFVVQAKVGVNYDLKNVKVQLEKGSSATDFEPYVGGTASPNPDYPQDVNVVTGSQTFTITNGANVQTYPITLGTIELAKIGTYQDYIYKNGDKWYTHKEIGSLTYNGSENFVMFGNNSGFFIGNDEALAPTSATDIGTMAVKSNYYTNCLFNDIYTMNISYGVSLYGATTTRHRICFRNKDISSASDFKTWLSTHNTTVYYALATPTDTEITDTTLISDLNTILADGHLTKGTNVLQTTATGTNLPTIIYVKTN